MTSDGEFNGRRVTVMGLGRFGGGAGAARWLALQGARVLVTDLAPADSLAESIEPLQDLIDAGSVTLRLGEHVMDDFTSADLVVATPAAPHPWRNEFLVAARDAGVAITTEIGLLVDRLHSRRVVGVTGTAGKSTTVSMIACALGVAVSHEVRVHVGGNIGGSLLMSLGEIRSRDIVVLELSSFMLYWLGAGEIGRRAWAPQVAVVTNFSPNHLDWHGDLEHYRASKAAIFTHQREDDAALFGDDETRASFPEAAACVDAALSDDLVDRLGRVRLAVPGEHNRRNALLAIRAASAMMGADVDVSRLVEAVAGFAGLHHRLEHVMDLPAAGGGEPIRIVDDSKSTTPRATCLAVQAFDDDPAFGAARVHLIAGGYDKGADLSPIARLTPRLAGLYAIGATGPDIIAQAPDGSTVSGSGSIDKAVSEALGRARPGDVLLLSPGCASWDQFSSYEERGRAFAQAVSRWASFQKISK